MQRANIRDRGSIERIYPRAVFENEANANVRAKASVLNGVTISSAVDGGGGFDLARASRHVGEQEAESGAIFICPFAQKKGAAAFAGDDPRRGDGGGARQPADPYAEFIDKVIAAAQEARIDPSPGPGDSRLRGLRQ
jgi:hypothetical protein